MIRHHPVYKYNVNLILQKKFSANTTFFCKIKLLRKFCTGKRVKFLIGSGVSDAWFDRAGAFVKDKCFQKLQSKFNLL